MKRIITAVILLTLTITATAQQSGRTSPASPAAKTDQSIVSGGSITGRITGDGQPLTNVAVMAFPVNLFENSGNLFASMMRPVKTGPDGQFEIKDMPSGSYTLYALAPGYIQSGNQRSYYRPGDSATLSMVKGGVITGKVTNTTGEPVVGIPVRAIRIKDADNRRVRFEIGDMINSSLFGNSNEGWYTDDRGIYRIYGLNAGVYRIATGNGGSSYDEGPYSNSTPTYYPSSSADTASEVSVQAGQEVTGIDIRFRESSGFSISGKVTGQVQEGVSVMLVHAATGQIEEGSRVATNQSGQTFLFDPVEEGDYFIHAVSTGGFGLMEGSLSASVPRRVSVKGADVTGIEIAITPLASIAGRVVIERASGADPKQCKPASPTSVQETALRVSNPRKGGLKTEPESVFSSFAVSLPDDKGEFKIKFVEAGLKRFAIEIPGEALYLKSIMIPASTGKAKPVDIAKDGIDIKASQNVTGITVTLSEGAAHLTGRVVIPKDDTTPFSRMKVYMVPAEQDAAENLLRYFEATVQSDGAFKLANLAPGRYWILARPLMEEESVESVSKPMAWNAADRMGLRFEGEAAATVIELKQCQRIADYSLRYATPAKSSKPVKK